MAILPTTGHILKIGDKVKMNIKEIEKGDMDGVEFTKTGENYWRYICAHPDEVYTITDIDLNYDECPYILSGFLDNNTWSSEELILVPDPADNFEVIKNMTREEMIEQLPDMLHKQFGLNLSKKDIQEWINAKP